MYHHKMFSIIVRTLIISILTVCLVIPALADEGPLAHNILYANAESPIIYDDDRLYMEYTGKTIFVEEHNTYLEEFYIENRTQQGIYIYTPVISVNGIVVNGYLNEYIATGCRAYIYIQVFDANLDILCNKPLGTLNVKFCVYADNETEDDIVQDNIICTTSSVHESEYDPSHYPSDFLYYQEDDIDVRLAGIRYLQSYNAYELYGLITNKSLSHSFGCDVIDINVNGTIFTPQTILQIAPDTSCMFSMYLTEDYLYMPLENDDQISMTLEIYRDDAEYDEETDSFDISYRIPVTMTYGQLLNLSAKEE